VETPEFSLALQALEALAPSDVTDTLLRLARRAGALEVVAYLVDFEHRVLIPVPDRDMHVDAPVGIEVAGTAAGTCFAERRPVTGVSDRGAVVWVPVLEGSECTGVLALTLATEPNERTMEHCRELGLLAGAVIAITARQTDLFNLVRRRKAMSLPASLQWDLLPPLRIDTPEAFSSGVLEPAYDVGGDSFDHAVNGFTLDVAIMDAMGHGLHSSLTSALAVGSYRHDRREGQPLSVIHRRLDSVLAERFGGQTFVTGQLAQLDLRRGVLTWINAGHPRPLLLRRGRLVDALACRPSRPWGVGSPLVEQAEEQLEPGDVVVFYSDGVVEGRSADGTPYGVDRFVAGIELAMASSASSDLILRRTIHDVMDHQDNRLRDDATLVWVEWDPPR
jgi:serine phosphatase RsbU (regulator of sigma subunit)